MEKGCLGSGVSTGDRAKIRGKNKSRDMVSLKRRLGTVFTVAFSTILAIVIELKLYRWCFLFSNHLVCELGLEVREDLLLLLAVFVSWMIDRLEVVC